MNTLKHEEAYLEGCRNMAELSEALSTYLEHVYSGTHLFCALG